MEPGCIDRTEQSTRGVDDGIRKVAIVGGTSALRDLKKVFHCCSRSIVGRMVRLGRAFRVSGGEVTKAAPQNYLRNPVRRTQWFEHGVENRITMPY